MLSTLILSAALVGGPASAIEWRRAFDAALEDAKNADRPLLVAFVSESDVWCRLMEKDTFRDPAVVEGSHLFVPVRIDTEAGPEAVTLAARYRVSSLPTIVFLSPSGRQVLKVDGFQGAGVFPRTLGAARKLAGRVASWEREVEKDADHAQALAGLGLHLYEQGQLQEARDLLLRAREADENEPTSARKEVRLRLGMIQYYDGRYEAADEILGEALRLGSDAEHDPGLLYVMGRNAEKQERWETASDRYRAILHRFGSSPLAQAARRALRGLPRRH